VIAFQQEEGKTKHTTTEQWCEFFVFVFLQKNTNGIGYT